MSTTFNPYFYFSNQWCAETHMVPNGRARGDSAPGGDCDARALRPRLFPTPLAAAALQHAHCSPCFVSGHESPHKHGERATQRPLPSALPGLRSGHAVRGPGGASGLRLLPSLFPFSSPIPAQVWEHLSLRHI